MLQSECKKKITSFTSLPDAVAIVVDVVVVAVANIEKKSSLLPSAVAFAVVGRRWQPAATPDVFNCETKNK